MNRSWLVGGCLPASTGCLRVKERGRESERWRSRREEREHSMIMGLISIYTIMILTGLTILLIELNEIIIGKGELSASWEVPWQSRSIAA